MEMGCKGLIFWLLFFVLGFKVCVGVFVFNFFVFSFWHRLAGDEFLTFATGWAETISSCLCVFGSACEGVCVCLCFQCVSVSF